MYEFLRSNSSDSYRPKPKTGFFQKNPVSWPVKIDKVIYMHVCNAHHLP